jgi:hypothetical protein
MDGWLIHDAVVNSLEPIIEPAMSLPQGQYPGQGLNIRMTVVNEQALETEVVWIRNVAA